VFALVDGNNFYASCERVFQPELRNRPLVVLSNNDGCCIARSAEAKALGIRMAQPIFEVPAEIRRRLAVRSANFTLYGDMSARVVAILREAAPRVEVYSVDESFLDLRGVRDRVAFAHDLRTKIHRWTGIPNCIGIAPTKTLAKLANRQAKRGEGVVDLTDAAVRAQVLAEFPVADVWGVGPSYAARLAERGITTAAHLRDAPLDDILSAFGVTLARTVRELQGQSCMELEEVEPDRQQIMVSRSFGQRVEDHAAVGQALATFCIRAAEKLRARGLVAAAMGVFATTDTFRAELRQHHPHRMVNLAVPTSDTRLLLTALRGVLDRRFLREGCGYKKAGIWLTDLARPRDLQGDLFSPPTAGDDRLMATMDAINRRFGRGTVGFASSGWQHSPRWGMRQENLSQRFTTCAAELPIAVC